MKPKIPRVYIAGKFRGPTNADVEFHIAVAKRFMAPIAELGCMPVCVHAMEGLQLHDVQQVNNGQFWLDATMAELETCDAVVVVPGWRASSGTLAEIARANELGLPVYEATWTLDQYAELCVDAMPEPSWVNKWRLLAPEVGQFLFFADWVAAQLQK